MYFRANKNLGWDKFEFHTRDYRVTQKVSGLGWVDLELGSSPGRWAGTMVTYCQSRMVEHLKSKST